MVNPSGLVSPKSCPPGPRSSRSDPLGVSGFGSLFEVVMVLTGTLLGALRLYYPRWVEFFRFVSCQAVSIQLTVDHDDSNARWCGSAETWFFLFSDSLFDIWRLEHSASLFLAPQVRAPPNGSVQSVRLCSWSSITNQCATRNRLRAHKAQTMHARKI